MDQIGKNMDDLDMIDPGLLIANGGRAVCKPEVWKGKSQWCEHAQIFHPIRGEGWGVIDGKRTAFKPRQLYFIPPCRRMTFGTSSGMVVEWLHFSPQAVVLRHRLAKCDNIIHFHKAFSSSWAPVCHLIPQVLKEGTAAGTCRVHALILEVTGLVLQGLPEEGAEERAAYERLLPALKLLEQTSGPCPSLTTLAQTAFLSPEYFHRLFKGVFHISPFRYALARRMNLAQQLLSEGGRSLTIIAERCGYDDPLYFSRVFRQYFGVAPSKVLRGQVLIGMPGLNKASLRA